MAPTGGTVAAKITKSFYLASPFSLSARDVKIIVCTQNLASKKLSLVANLEEIGCLNLATTGYQCSLGGNHFF
jgi:hypothetical protein